MVARKHGLYHTCINIINSMYGFNAMEVQEAFTKIKEQVCPCTLTCAQTEFSLP